VQNSILSLLPQTSLTRKEREGGVDMVYHPTSYAIHFFFNIIEGEEKERGRMERADMERLRGLLGISRPFDLPHLLVQRRLPKGKKRCSLEHGLDFFLLWRKRGEKKKEKQRRPVTVGFNLVHQKKKKEK